MKDMIINEGSKYWFRGADGSRTRITSKKAQTIFKGWQDAGLTIKRKYGLGGQVTWIWAE